MYPFIQILNFQVPTYGLLMVLGCGVSVLLSLKRCARFGCVREDVITILACVGGIGILFAKLLFLCVSIPFDVLVEHIRNGQIQPLLEGGQVFYGFIFGGVIGVAIGIKIAKADLGAALLTIIPTIPLGHALGRIGCFMAGCCYGMEYHGFGSVMYPAHNVGDAPFEVPLFPIQCLEALINVVIFVVLLRVSQRTMSAARTTGLYIVLYAIARFFLEYFRGDTIRGGAWIFSTSQWISLLMVLVVCIYSFFRILRKRRFVSDGKAARI